MSRAAAGLGMTGYPFREATETPAVERGRGTRRRGAGNGFRSLRPPVRNIPAWRRACRPDAGASAVWRRACRSGLPGRLPAALQRRVAHRLLEQPERRQVLGRAPGDQAGRAAAAPEPERQGPEGRPGQPVQEVERQPGEPGAGSEQEQPGRIGAEDGLHPPAGPCVERVQDPVRGRAAAGGGRRGAAVIDPRPGHEVADRGSAGQQGMLGMGDDPRGRVEDAFAPEECGKRRAVDGAAMQVALAAREPPQARGEGCGAQGELDAGTGVAEPGDRRGEDRLHPHRIRGDPEAAGAAGDRRRDLRLRGLDLAQDMARAVGGHGPERGEPDARRQALEQPPAEAELEPGDDAAERGLGDGEPLGGGEDGVFSTTRRRPLRPSASASRRQPSRAWRRASSCSRDPPPTCGWSSISMGKRGRFRPSTRAAIHGWRSGTRIPGFSLRGSSRGPKFSRDTR